MCQPTVLCNRESISEKIPPSHHYASNQSPPLVRSQLDRDMEPVATEVCATEDVYRRRVLELQLSVSERANQPPDQNTPMHNNFYACDPLVYCLIENSVQDNFTRSSSSVRNAVEVSLCRMWLAEAEETIPIKGQNSQAPRAVEGTSCSAYCSIPRSISQCSKLTSRSRKILW